MNTSAPAKMTVRKNPHHLKITRRRFDYIYIFWALVVIAYDIFGLPYFFHWYIEIISIPKIDILSILFPLLNPLIILASNYALIVCFFNSTVLNVTSNVISVEDRPFPLWGNKRLASKEVLQLFCKKEKVWNKFYFDTVFSVEAIVNNKSNVTLLYNLKQAEQALFVKQEIEKFLNIEDKPIKGEFK